MVDILAIQETIIESGSKYTEYIPPSKEYCVRVGLDDNIYRGNTRERAWEKLEKLFLKKDWVYLTVTQDGTVIGLDVLLAMSYHDAINACKTTPDASYHLMSKEMFLKETGDTIRKLGL